MGCIIDEGELYLTVLMEVRCHGKCRPMTGTCSGPQVAHTAATVRATGDNRCNFTSYIYISYKIAPYRFPVKIKLRENYIANFKMVEFQKISMWFQLLLLPLKLLITGWDNLSITCQVLSIILNSPRVENCRLSPLAQGRFTE